MTQLAADNAIHFNTEFKFAPGWYSATLLQQEKTGYRVRMSGSAQVGKAVRALSCLMEPAVGDKVGIFIDEEGGAFVVSVLERSSAQQPPDSVDACLHFPGRLSISADDGLSLQTKKLLNIEADHLLGKVSEVRWFSKVIRLSGKELSITTQVARLICKVRELLTAQSSFSAEHSCRHISESELVRAKVYDVKSQSMASIESPCTLLKGENLIKVDSSQVHIG